MLNKSIIAKLSIVVMLASLVADAFALSRQEAEQALYDGASLMLQHRDRTSKDFPNLAERVFDRVVAKIENGTFSLHDTALFFCMSKIVPRGQVLEKVYTELRATFFDKADELELFTNYLEKYSAYEILVPDEYMITMLIKAHEQLEKYPALRYALCRSINKEFAYQNRRDSGIAFVIVFGVAVVGALMLSGIQSPVYS